MQLRLSELIQEETKMCAVSVDRTRDLQIFSLTLSQLSYPRRDSVTGIRLRIAWMRARYPNHLDYQPRSLDTTSY